MTKHDWIEIGALVAGGIAVFFVLNRSSLAQPQEVTDGTPAPGYLDYNQPMRTQVPTDNNDINLPEYQGNGNGCSCGASANLITFSDTGSFASVLEDQLGGALQQYSDAVLAQYPDYVRQFFNATDAVDQSQQAATRFASF